MKSFQLLLILGIMTLAAVNSEGIRSGNRILAAKSSKAPSVKSTKAPTTPLQCWGGHVKGSIGGGGTWCCRGAIGKWPTLWMPMIWCGAI